MKKSNIAVLIILLAALALSAPAIAQPSSLSPQEVRTIAEKAYAFGYPLVLMEFTRRNAMERPSLGGSAQTNEFKHAQAFPDATFRQVIRPNADTLYSSAWLDLSKEPILLHVPDTRGRYYLMQFMDAWTETFSVPGKRSTGTGEGWFGITGPGWKGTLPAGVQRIDAPTNMAWIIGRTQTNNSSDYDNVHAIQKGYFLTPLSQYPNRPAAVRPPARPAEKSTPAVRPPVQVERLNATEFFRAFAQLLERNPPHPGDEPMMRELARIGIVPGKPFQPEALGAAGVKALEEGARVTSSKLAALDGRAPHTGKNGWSVGGKNVGRYGTDYANRALIARIGLGANPPEDASYAHCHVDADGRPLDGELQYRIHFEKGQVPPVKAFWSVTMYSDEGYFVPNPINRFAIGDRDPLVFNADGSLDLYIQRNAPGGSKNANWLPAPVGKFNLSLRMYWPGDEIISGRWAPPPLLRTK